MSLSFEIGDEYSPRGHAIIYYTSGSKYFMAYIVIIPISFDFTKFMPPVISSQINAEDMAGFSAFALPPVPEEIPDGYDFIKDLATSRNDDLIYGGTFNESNLIESAQSVNNQVENYSELYKNSQNSNHKPISESSDDLNVQNVMLSLMSEKDKLGEISKLIGKLQFAVEGKDLDQVQETEVEIKNISSFFTEEYKIGAILQLVKNNSLNSNKLIQLYIERCYKLADNDADAVSLLDREIDEIN
ncbi:MAG: hypothetical protein FI695_00765 [SAR202 cluster bacterium]|nr:hypothetical protein [Chloroflexota bacterium]MQG50495.1 hypothetical protein [SAR202 cluster bacterium]|tara:strand:- start:2392 stop:3123 length:732 start_codon:yes stop_codon:yes gene_type:complete